MNGTAAFMRELDAEYRDVSGLEERRHYSIFYSRIEQNPIFVLGYNPGGNPETWSESKLASRSFYEKGEHEYVDCDYPLAVAMRAFLLKLLANDGLDGIRKIPKTNLIFRRSTNQNTLAASELAGLREAKPFVERMIARCAPQLVICEGMTTLKAFERHYCTDVLKHADGPEISTPNGRNRAAIYTLDRAFVHCLDRDVLVIGLGHPSRYAKRKEWTEVVGRACSAARGTLASE